MASSTSSIQTDLLQVKYLEKERLRLARELEESQENCKAFEEMLSNKDKLYRKETEEFEQTRKGLLQEIYKLRPYETEYKRIVKEHQDLLDGKNRYETNYKELQQRFNDQNKILQESQKKFNDQGMVLQRLRQKCDNQSMNLRDLQQKYENQNMNLRESRQKYDNQSKNLQQVQQKCNNQSKTLRELQQQYNNQIMNLQQKYDNQITVSEKQCKELEQQLDDNRSQMSLLKQKNNELKEEAANYQAALGDAKNLKMSDDDTNHNVQLNQDIISLQDKIDNYVTSLAKNKVDVKIDKVTKLLPRYDCQTKIDSKNPDKLFMKAILQRYVLEMIFVYAKNYFDEYKSNKLKDGDYLESDIARKTDELYEAMEIFANARNGIDEITKVTPIKLRQLVYTVLGMRGLGNTHSFIKTYTAHLNNSMNQYRVVSDPKRKEYLNGLAEDLIREVFRIFYFRLKIQEPIAQYHWFKSGDKVNKISMKINCQDDEIDDLVVDLCTFPLIGQNMNSNQKIFTPAKVFACHKSCHIPRLSLVSKAKNTIKYLYNYGENSNSYFDYFDYFDYPKSSNSNGSYIQDNSERSRDVATEKKGGEKREDGGEKREGDEYNKTKKGD